MAKLDGSKYRLRKFHPRRSGPKWREKSGLPDQPLTRIHSKGVRAPMVTSRDKNCSKLSQEQLRSALSCGFIELIEEKLKAGKPAKKKRGN